ncbi:MAG: hypothetical protein CVU42_12820 [Chloroflexi bacterium HGW-Chloroflexi-4]|nr:MAG: hypothetical protein CVU42_12820 [Chloroflexi bacterium HGW-Chloroflexi-4]
MNDMNNNNMFGLEEKLSNMLKPVMPDPVFMNNLKTKLAKTPAILIEKSKRRMGILVVGAGLFAGALTVWIISKLKKS